MEIKRELNDIKNKESLLEKKLSKSWKKKKRKKQ